MTVPAIDITDPVTGKVERHLLRPSTMDEKLAAGYVTPHNPTGLVPAACEHGLPPADGPGGMAACKWGGRSWIRSAALDNYGRCPLDPKYDGDLEKGTLPVWAVQPADFQPRKEAHCPDAAA